MAFPSLRCHTCLPSLVGKFEEYLFSLTSKMNKHFDMEFVCSWRFAILKLLKTLFSSSKERSSSKFATFALGPRCLYFSSCIFSPSFSVRLQALFTDAENLLNASAFSRSSAIFTSSSCIGFGFVLLFSPLRLLKCLSFCSAASKSWFSACCGPYFKLWFLFYSLYNSGFMDSKWSFYWWKDIVVT